MARIKSRDYKRCYHLHLLPDTVKGDWLQYYPKPGEIAPYYAHLIKLLKMLKLDSGVSRHLVKQLQQVRAAGGLLFALEPLRLSNADYVNDPDWVIMYEGMEADKDVKLFLANSIQCVSFKR